MRGYFCIGFIDFMLAGKTLFDYTSLFSPYDLKKMTIKFLVILKMSEVTNTYSNLSDQTKFRLNEINKIKDCFNSEIQERKIMGKKFSKYIAASDYFDETVIVLSATNGGISIISFTSVIGVPVRIASASYSLIFSLATGIIKTLLKITRNNNKKHNRIVMAARSKLNSIEKLVSQALIDLEISHEEYKTIINEEENYRRLKEKIRMMKSDKEKAELSYHNKNIRENNGNA